MRLGYINGCGPWTYNVNQNFSIMFNSVFDIGHDQFYSSQLFFRGFTISSLLYLDKMAKGYKSHIKTVLHCVIFYHTLTKCLENAAIRFVQRLQKLPNKMELIERIIILLK